MSASARETAVDAKPHILCDGQGALIEISSDPNFLAPLRAFVTTLASRIGFGETEQFQVALAVDEAVANIINHGYERRFDGRIWLRISRVSEPKSGIRVILDDEGVQVDPCRIKSRDLEDVRPGGLGVHIIREVMDECIWEQRPEAGMRLTLIKYALPTAAEDASPNAGSDDATGSTDSQSAPSDAT